MSRLRARRGFSLVELLTVLGVVGCLTGIIVPWIIQAREAARKNNCYNNMKQLALGLQNYHEVFMVFPPGWFSAHPADSTGAESWAWGFLVFPFLE